VRSRYRLRLPLLLYPWNPLFEVVRHLEILHCHLSTPVFSKHSSGGTALGNTYIVNFVSNPGIYDVDPRSFSGILVVHEVFELFIFHFPRDGVRTRYRMQRFVLMTYFG
jgi:hypothetical protein